MGSGQRLLRPYIRCRARQRPHSNVGAATLRERAISEVPAGVPTSAPRTCFRPKLSGKPTHNTSRRFEEARSYHGCVGNEARAYSTLALARSALATMRKFGASLLDVERRFVMPKSKG